MLVILLLASLQGCAGPAAYRPCVDNGICDKDSVAERHTHSHSGKKQSGISNAVKGCPGRQADCIHENDLGRFQSAKIIGTDAGFTLLTQKTRGDIFQMQALSPDGAILWEKPLPCDGIFHKGNLSHLSCEDRSRRTLRGVSTRNGKTAWEKRFPAGITHVSHQGDELVVEVDEKIAYRLRLADGKLVRKETPIPKAARTFIERVGDYLISETTIPHIFKTDLMWTRAYEDNGHVRSDGGILHPTFKVRDQGLFFFGRHHETQTDIAMAAPDHHRIIWTAPWPFAHEPTNYLLSAHQNIVTWGDGSHWAAYSLVDGKIVGTGRRNKMDQVVVAHGRSATLEKRDAYRRKLVIRTLQIQEADLALTKRPPFQKMPAWFSSQNRFTFMVVRHDDLDLTNGSWDKTEITSFVMDAVMQEGALQVDWKIRRDGREPRGTFQVDERAYLEGNTIFTDLSKLQPDQRFTDRSILILPKKIFQEALTQGRARWRDVHGGDSSLEYLGPTWHQAHFDYGERASVQIMPAHLFRSGDVEYRVVESDGLPILVSANHGDWQVHLVTLEFSPKNKNRTEKRSKRKRTRKKKRRR